MVSTSRIDMIKTKLRQLKNKDTKLKVIGASKHRYDSYKIEPKDIYIFEEQMGMTLPIEYRTFLQYIGNGAGPGYGILSFNEIRNVLKKMENEIEKKTNSSGYFQFSNETIQKTLEARNNLTTYEKLTLQKLDGLLPVCHYGGTNYIYIVIAGDGEGTIWNLNTDGYETVPAGNIFHYYFLDWIESWLDSNLGEQKHDPLAGFYQEYLKKIIRQEKDLDINQPKKLFLLKENLVEFCEFEYDLNNLEWLSMNNCGLNSLPEKIFNLRNLKGLDIEFNNISDIYPSLSKLKKLEYLSISHNNIKVIPESLKSLKELKILDTSYNNIDYIPDYMSNLVNLEYINMSNNKIKEIHHSISKLKKLNKIDLSNNLGVFGLNSLIAMKELEILNLSGCNLLIFPYYITMLQKIKKLYLVGNGFNRLPNEMENLQSLQVLTLNDAIAENLEQNIEIIAKLKNLQEIYLPYIELFKPPKNIIKLKNLKKITMYPALSNRDKSLDKEILTLFIKKLEQVLEGCIIELIY